MPTRKTAVEKGTKWGKLTVVKPLEKNECSHVLWLCKCDCGQKIKVWGYNLVKKKGKTVSCGCIRPSFKRRYVK